MKISVGVKIATIIVVLLVLVGAASWINARSAHRVQGLIKEVDTVYVPAYSAMARTNLRLVEEGLLVRRLLLAQLTAIEAGSSQDELKQAIAAKARLGLETLAEARGLVQQAASDPVVAEDRPELARLDTMLDFLGQRQAEYEAAVVALQKAIEQGTSAAGATTEANLAEISEEMKRLDLERTALNDQAEAARMKMRELLDHASNLAIHEQDVSVKVGLVLLGLA